MGPGRTRRELERRGEKLLEEYAADLERAVRAGHAAKQVDARYQQRRYALLRKIASESRAEPRLTEWAAAYFKYFENQCAVLLLRAQEMEAARRKVPAANRGDFDLAVVASTIGDLTRDALTGRSDASSAASSPSTTAKAQLRRGLEQLLDSVWSDLSSLFATSDMRRVRDSMVREIENKAQDFDDAWWMAQRMAPHLREYLQESLRLRTRLVELSAASLFGAEGAAQERQRVERQLKRAENRLERRMDWVGLRMYARRFFHEVEDVFKELEKLGAR